VPEHRGGVERYTAEGGSDPFVLREHRGRYFGVDAEAAVVAGLGTQPRRFGAAWAHPATFRLGVHHRPLRANLALHKETQHSSHRLIPISTTPRRNRPPMVL
jgi:hypothetical protein